DFEGDFRRFSHFCRSHRRRHNRRLTRRLNRKSSDKWFKSIASQISDIIPL
ncbi:unnamed protein product, partial [Brassica oleracea]